jgi:hypothetical protein
MNGGRLLLVVTLMASCCASQFEGSGFVRQLTVADGQELFKGEGMSVVLFYGTVE